MRDYDVVVIGLGPTGGTLANLLAQCGVSVCVIEREAAIYNLPRAVHFDDEIMRVFQTVGIADALRKHLIVNRGARFVDPGGQVLLDWPRPKTITENGWNSSYRFHQPDLERHLRRAMVKSGKIDITQNAKVTAISDHGDHVETFFQIGDTGESKSVRCKYLIGCDGARSVTRSAMNVVMDNLGFEQSWVVIDVILSAPKDDLPDRTIQYCNPDRPATYCRNVGSRRRWEFAIRPDEDPEALTTDDAIWAYLKPWLGPDDAVLERKAVYSFKSALAQDWRKGRLFLAGDAAHLMPPFMGQGMCAGIRDASNLAWKLAHCIHHGHDDEVLNSYQSERQSNVSEYIQTTSRMGEFINALGTEQVANTVFTKPDGSVGMNSIKPGLGFGLGDPQDKLRGQTFPNIRLADGTSFDRFFAKAPMIIASAALTIPDNMPKNIISTAKMPEIDTILHDFGANALLVRPDRFIMASLTTNQPQLTVAEFARRNQLVLN